MVIAAAAVGIRQVSAIPCAAYDGTGQVGYVFGAPYGDLSLGSDLSDPSAFVSLNNKTGRPDFTGSNTQCFVVSSSQDNSLTTIADNLASTSPMIAIYFRSTIFRINSQMAST